MSSWLEAAFGDWLGVSVMFDTSCPSRDGILKEYSVTDSESVWCLTLHVPHETVYWRNTRWLTRSQCDVWHFMSLTRRYTEGILGDWLGVSVMFDTSCPSRDDILKWRNTLCCLRANLTHRNSFYVLWKITDLSWNTRRSPSIFLCFNAVISNPTR